MPTNTTSFRADWLSRIIGQRVRELRIASGRSQDQLAILMRHTADFSWTRSMVDALERGRKTIDPETLCVLALALQTSLPDLVRVDYAAALSDRLFATPSALAKLFSGANPSALAESELTLFEPREAVATAPPEETDGFEHVELSLEDYLGNWGELERAMAKRFGASMKRVLLACFDLWGHSATEEREARAIERPTAKQWISRGLFSEIGDLLGRIEDTPTTKPKKPRRKGKKL